MRSVTITLLLLLSWGGFLFSETAHRFITKAVGPITVDGVIDEAAWESALFIDEFYEVQPGENVEPPVRTVAYLTYDDNNFYMAFRCLDPDPSSIRARYADRDSAWADDFVGIMLNTFNDQRDGFEFFINPLGAQMDLTRKEPWYEDSSWDGIWDSAGRITAEGYEVEAAIPFKTLRFPNVDVQTWRFFLYRAYPRTFRYQLFSMPHDRDLNCFFCQSDTMVGMEGVRPSRNLEIVPTLTGTSVESRDEPELPFGSTDTEWEAGLNVTWGVTPNLILNGTINPDFSQIEADVEQIDVNTRYSLFYSEKRPFFLEGNGYFSSYMNTVHTRTISDPSWGVKFTGKEGGNAFGAFFARDDQANFLIPSNQGSELYTWDHEVLSGVFRYRRDIGRDSTIGALYTGRKGGAYSFSLFGGDGRIRLGSNDFLQFQILKSTTTYPVDPENYEGFDGREVKGEAAYLEYEHSSREWDWSATYLDKDPNFRADLGFIPRVDVRSLFSNIGYSIYGDGNRFYERLRPSAYTFYTENHEGEITDQGAGIELGMHLKKQTNGEIGFERELERYNGKNYYKNQGWLWFNSRFSKTMTLYFDARIGDGVDYSNDRLGDLQDYRIQFDIRFGKKIFLDFQGRHQTIGVSEGTVFRASIFYLKTLYHFSNNVFLRAIVQYGDVNRSPELYLDEVNASENFIFSQLLFTYKINPFTLLFLGYSDHGMEEDNLDMTTMNRTLFLKLSYAFRP